MPLKIAKWGNSLGIRIPKHLLEQIKLQEGDEIEISATEDRLIVTPVKRIKYSLEELLEGMGEENLHPEIDWGEVTGIEQW
ncbi:MAG: AbrB/MazE/SpoVT family DNA-binding domain-containing protein [Stanieria sp.]|jgi:antitoxin MazE